VEQTSAVTTATPIEELFRREGPRLWHTVLAFSGGRRDVADDAVAEAFARAIEQQGRVRRMEPWLYRVALNVAKRELKRRGREAPLDGVDLAGPDAEHPEPVRALRQLSPGQRTALYLHYQEDLPVKEVARLMATTPAVVKVHLSRGRKRLRELLGGDDDA